jgi:hypothetical protein
VKHVFISTGSNKWELIQQKHSHKDKITTSTFHERNNRKYLPALLLSAYVGRLRFARYQCSTQVLGTAWKYSRYSSMNQTNHLSYKENESNKPKVRDFA